MNDFKVGDTYWYIDIEYLEGTIDGMNIIDPNEMYLQSSIINEKNGFIKNLTVYKTKQECIQAFKDRLDEL